MKRKFIAIITGTLLMAGALAGCGDGTGTGTDSEGTFDIGSEISVISREDGSGTRGAFTELFGIIEENDKGEKVDLTTQSADITQSTGVVLTSVADNPYSIGYVSLGSLNDSVKPLSIDGAEATTDNIKNGSYKIARPFNIATKGEMRAEVKDFINYIMSKEGQTIVEEEGYISNENTGAFKGADVKGKITIMGSSSVTPVMEKLKEGYKGLNNQVSIEVSQSDSTNGMNSVIDGICDIGMASREVKDTELEKGINNKVIALDGISVVVNLENSLNEMTSINVKEIYSGNVTTWDGLQ